MPRRNAPTGDPALKTPARRALRAAVLAEVKAGRECEMPRCDMPSRAIHWWAPRGNPWAYVLDEITPRSAGGSAEDPQNVRPAHHRCNSIAGIRITHAKRRAKAGRAGPERSATATRW